MPKLKTRKSAAARLTISASGKILRRGKGIRHLLEHLSASVKRRRHKRREVAAADDRRLRRLLPYA